MALNIQDSRILIKSSTIAGEVPTAAPSNDFTDGTWTSLDIYKSELFTNRVNEKVWLRFESSIKQLTVATNPTTNRLTYWNASGHLDNIDAPTDGLYLKYTTANGYEWATVSAGIDGSGDANRVTFWQDADTVTSDANFTYSSSNLKIGATTALWSLNNRFTISENIDGIVNIEFTNKSTDAGARIINIWGQSTSNYAIISRLSPNWGVLGFQSVDASNSYSIQNNTTTGGTGGGSIILNGNPIYLMPGTDVDAPAMKLDNDSVYINTNENIHNTPDGSAALEIVSTSKGFLPPRMDGLGIETISAPAEGLMVYCNNGNGTTVNSTGWWGYNGSTWVKIN